MILESKNEGKKCSVCNEFKLFKDYYSQKFYSRVRGEYIHYQPYCKECAKKKNREWTISNPDKYKVSNDKRNEKRKERNILYANERRKNGKYLEWARTEQGKEIMRKHSKNRKKYKQHEISNSEWENCQKYFNNKCAYCNLSKEEHNIMRLGKLVNYNFHKEHVDHEGLNDLSNCVPSCQSCNSSKFDKKLNDWYNPNNPKFKRKNLERIHQWLNEDYLKFKE